MPWPIWLCRDQNARGGRVSETEGSAGRRARRKRDENRRVREAEFEALSETNRAEDMEPFTRHKNALAEDRDGKVS